MDQSKPIKRSQALTILSREHHDGLLLGFKIRQGIKYQVETGRIASYCKWFWDQHLSSHFEQEEEVLVPYLDSMPELKEQFLSEHREIKKALEKALKEQTYDNYEHFGQLLNDHIRFEERILFNEIEKSVTSGELEQIGARLDHEKQSCDDWPDEFWVKK